MLSSEYEVFPPGPCFEPADSIILEGSGIFSEVGCGWRKWSLAEWGFEGDSCSHAPFPSGRWATTLVSWTEPLSEASPSFLKGLWAFCHSGENNESLPPCFSDTGRAHEVGNVSSSHGPQLTRK